MIVFSFFCSPFNRARRAFRIIEKRAAWRSLLPSIHPLSRFDISISFLLFRWGSLRGCCSQDRRWDMGRFFRDLIVICSVGHFLKHLYYMAVARSTQKISKTDSFEIFSHAFW